MGFPQDDGVQGSGEVTGAACKLLAVGLESGGLQLWGVMQKQKQVQEQQQQQVPQGGAEGDTLHSQQQQQQVQQQQRQQVQQQQQQQQQQQVQQGWVAGSRGHQGEGSSSSRNHTGTGSAVSSGDGGWEAWPVWHSDAFCCHAGAVNGVVWRQSQHQSSGPYHTTPGPQHHRNAGPPHSPSAADPGLEGDSKRGESVLQFATCSDDHSVRVFAVDWEALAGRGGGRGV